MATKQYCPAQAEHPPPAASLDSSGLDLAGETKQSASALHVNTIFCYVQNQVGEALLENCSQPPGSPRMTECGSHTDGEQAVCRATSSSQRTLSTWLRGELAAAHHSLCSKITGKAVYKPAKGGSFIQKKRLQRKSSCLAYNLFPCLLLPGDPAVSNADRIRRGENTRW